MEIVSRTALATVTAASYPPPAAPPPVRILRVRDPPRNLPVCCLLRFESAVGRNPSSWRLKADLMAIEPDLIEDKIDRWRTNGVSPDFKYGEYECMMGITRTSKGMRVISGSRWPKSMKLRNLRLVFKGEYLYIAAAIFTIVFCAIEINKPDQPHNFEPEIYNMDREARDKLIFKQLKSPD